MIVLAPHRKSGTAYEIRSHLIFIGDETFLVRGREPGSNRLVDPEVIRYLVPAVVILDDRIIIQYAEGTIFQRQACQTGRPGTSVENVKRFVRIKGVSGGVRNSPVQPDTPRLGGIVRVNCKRSIRFFECPEEQSIIGMTGSVDRDITSKITWQRPCDIGQWLCYLKIYVYVPPRLEMAALTIRVLY